MTPLVRTLVVLFLMVICAAPALGQDRPRPAAYHVLYGAEDEPNRRLDVYLPEGFEPPYPVMLMFHGYGQNKAEASTLMLPEIAARAGVATVAVNYSLLMPDVYLDAYCALAWVQANAADYGLDPAQVVTFGVSYGALPATMLAVQEQPDALPLDCPHPAPDPEAVRGVVSLAGALLGTADALRIYQPEMPLWQDQTTAALLSSTPPEHWLSLDLPAETLGYLALWPMTWIDPSEPPHLLIHGAGDSVVPYQSTYAYAEILSRNRTNAMLVIDRLAGHVPAPALFDRELETFLGRVTGG